MMLLGLFEVRWLVKLYYAICLLICLKIGEENDVIATSY